MPEFRNSAASVALVSVTANFVPSANQKPVMEPQSINPPKFAAIAIKYTQER